MKRGRIATTLRPLASILERQLPLMPRRFHVYHTAVSLINLRFPSLGLLVTQGWWATSRQIKDLTGKRCLSEDIF